MYIKKFNCCFMKVQKMIWQTRNMQPLLCQKNVNEMLFSTAENVSPTERMTQTLRNKFPLAKNIEVVDVSGGCGSMYEISVESIEFKGLTTVKQHRLINETLKEDIKQMHGLRIQTTIPEEKG